MFKVFKYLFLANLYKRAKKSIFTLVGFFIILLFFTFIINDLLAVVNGVNIYILLSLKWIVIFLLFTLIARSFLKIMDMATTLSNNDNTPTNRVKSQDNKREYILTKEKLFSKEDTILEKYMKN